MRVGLYQSASPKGDLDAGLGIVEAALSQAAERNVAMLVMQELFLPGYGAVTKTPPGNWAGIQDKVAELCKKYKIALAIGLPEYADAYIYNSAFVFSDKGEQIARYRKLQLFGPKESSLFKSGNQYNTFKYKGVCFGLLICYDVEFPEHTRALTRNGAQVVLVPTANMQPFVNVNEVLVPARAAENGISVIYANYCGSENDLDYVGRSMICGPDGYSIASMGDETGLIIADIPIHQEDSPIPWSTQLDDLVT